MRNPDFKILFFQHFASTRVFRFFERVGLSKGRALMEMSKKKL